MSCNTGVAHGSLGLNNTSTTIIEKASSQSLKKFITYIKNDMIGTYRETCDIVNCYICCDNAE